MPARIKARTTTYVVGVYARQGNQIEEWEVRGASVSSLGEAEMQMLTVLTSDKKVAFTISMAAVAYCYQKSAAQLKIKAPEAKVTNRVPGLRPISKI